MAEDPYVYPGTAVLRNVRGIRDPDELRRVETSITYFHGLRLASQRPPGGYDLKHLQAFHRELFGDLYPWAGELRTVGIAKTDPFCLPQHLESFADGVFRALERDQHLRGLEQQQFVERAAHYLGEVNALHPFREGNGRAQRAFFSQLARDAGYRLRWGDVEPARNVEASIASLRGDPLPLRELLLAITDPLD